MRNMDKTTTTVKLWMETRKLLRLVSAMTGETIMEVAHRMADLEWKKVSNEKVPNEDVQVQAVSSKKE